MDGAVVSMAIWTLACHATVTLGGTLMQLLWTTPLLALAIVLLYRALVSRDARNRVLPDAMMVELTHEQEAGSAWRESVWLNLLAGSVAVVAIYLLHARPTFHAVWWLLVTYFGVTMLLAGPPRRTESPVRGPSMQWALAGLAALCAVAALVAHRADIDDCFYLNLAVSAADAPHEPLLAHDTLHGRSDLPLCLPIYRFHSLELLVGSLSYASGVPAIYIAHLLTPAVAAALCCFAWARLCRMLAPRDWLWLVLAVAMMYLLVGGPHRWYANFALVRLHQGKAILVTLCVPVLIAYGLQYASRPDWRNWVLLCLAQIAAMGTSSTALWVAPVTVTLALASHVGRSPMKALIAGVGSCWYLLLLGLSLRPQMAAAAASLAVFDAPGDAVTHAWNDVFGTGLLRDAALVALVFAWRASPSAVAARLCQVLPLVVLATLLNPYWAGEVTRYVTGNSAFWRVLWVVPCPLFIALVLAWPALCWKGLHGAWRGGAVAVACAVFGVVVAPWPTFSASNGVVVRRPGLKIDGGYLVAKALVQATAGRPHVLAPEPVAAWIPTFHRHPYPLMGRSIYLMSFQSRDPAEIQRRAALSAWMDGQGEWPVGATLLTESIESDRLGAICFSAAHRHCQELDALVRSHGFARIFSDGRYEVWTKPAATAVVKLPAADGQPERH